MRINSIELQNFRKFESKKLEFPSRFTVLIGENGAGKSSILEGIRFLLSHDFLVEIGYRFRNDELMRSFPVSKKLFRYWDDAFGNPIPASRFEIRSKYQIEGYGEPESMVSQELFDIEALIESESAKWKTRDNSFVQTNEFGIYNYIISISDGIVNGQNPILPVIDFFGVNRNSDFANKELPYIKNESPPENGYLGALDPLVGPNFLSWYKTFEDEAKKFPGKKFIKEHLQCVKNAIVSVIPEWTDISFSFPEDDLIGSFHNPDGSTEYRYFQDLSDGYKSMVAMVGSIAYRCIRLNPHLGIEAAKKSPGIVLIDELDLHLHPKWQKRVVADLKSTFPKIQFIATTHSPFIVQSLSEDELINLDREGDVAPNTLRLEDVAEEIMGVESAFSEESVALESLSRKYLEILENAERNRGIDEPSFESLNEIESQISDPSIRAFLQMQRLKKSK